MSRLRIAALSALTTAIFLIGGMLAGGLGGNLVFGSLPGHTLDVVRITLSALPALATVIASGALWGLIMATITGAGERSRMAWAGALGFGPTVLGVAIALTLLEEILVQRGLLQALPIHILFTLLFVPAAAIVAAVGALALGRVSRTPAQAKRLALISGLVGGIAFLIVNVLMDAAGWRIGAPGAAERFTMLTVAFAGSSAAALTAGAALGLGLARPEG